MDGNLLKMEKNKIYLALAILIIFLSVLNLFANYSEKPLQAQNISTSLEIANRTGIDLNNTSLTFSKILPGTSKQRKISIKNDYSFPLSVNLSTFGNISKFLSHPSNIVINVSEKKEISIVARVPKNHTLGHYKGYLQVEMYPK